MLTKSLQLFKKNCADEIAPILTIIIQKSLDSNQVPTDWKKAIVSPVFKKGDRSKPENYRPISLTSICCKISEHIIVSEMMKHLDKHTILQDSQHGFRKKRSCETQLLVTSHDLASILNRHSQADVAVLDFSKAFDKVPHQPLLEKLKHCNLHPDAVGWISSFLNNRTQNVVVDGFSSKESPVLSGVPQGSVLGPVLFLIFINDIADDISSAIRLFADDCLIYREIKNRDDQFALQRDLNKLVEWANTWGMEFNIQKCNVITITNMKKNRLSYSYKMNNQVIDGIRSSKYLGVTISNKLQWGAHISNISGAANRMLGFMWRNLRQAPKNIKEKAYTSFVRPKLEYCSSIWDPYQKQDIRKLELVQNRAARFVTNCPHKHTAIQPSITAKVQELGWDALQKRRQRSRLTMLYRVTNKLVEVPTAYHPTLREPQPRRGNQKQYVRLQPEVDAFKYSFLPRTIQDWNNLNSVVVTADSLESFKRYLY